MSEEQQVEAPQEEMKSSEEIVDSPSTEDVNWKNEWFALKRITDKKFDRIEEERRSLFDRLNALESNVTQNHISPGASEDQLRAIYQDDPIEATRQITRREMAQLKDAVVGDISKELQKIGAVNKVEQTFPEMKDKGSAFYQEALDLYRNDPSLKNSPMGIYNAAARVFAENPKYMQERLGRLNKDRENNRREKLSYHSTLDAGTGKSSPYAEESSDEVSDIEKECAARMGVSIKSYKSQQSAMQREMKEKDTVRKALRGEK
jgi:hypothetical protein